METAKFRSAGTYNHEKMGHYLTLVEWTDHKSPAKFKSDYAEWWYFIPVEKTPEPPYEEGYEIHFKYVLCQKRLVWYRAYNYITIAAAEALFETGDDEEEEVEWTAEDQKEFEAEVEKEFGSEIYAPEEIIYVFKHNGSTFSNKNPRGYTIETMGWNTPKGAMNYDITDSTGKTYPYTGKKWKNTVWLTKNF